MQPLLRRKIQSDLLTVRFTPHYRLQIMKINKFRNLSIACLLLLLPATSYAWDLRDLLSKAGEGLTDGKSTVTDILDGVFSKSDLDVKDLVGTWTVKGSAVTFRSENFLQQAGGTAAASVVEKKLDPYYSKYGLTGASLTINKDGTFSLKMKKFTLTGTVTRQKDSKTAGANFLFNFSKLGLTSIGEVDAFVSKSLTGMDIMFDASKLQTIMNAVASFSKMQTAQTLSTLLNSYDGICIGFKLTPASKK